MAKAGRKPKNDPDDVEAIQEKIDAYFVKLAKAEEEPTFAGLALALGYHSRSTLWEASRAQTSISVPLKTAMLKVEESYEKQLRTTSPTGAIFALKNRGWSDKTELELSGDKDKPVMVSISEIMK